MSEYLHKYLCLQYDAFKLSKYFKLEPVLKCLGDLLMQADCTVNGHAMNASPVQHTGETLPFEYYLLYLESLVPRYIKRYYGTLKF